MRAIATIFVGTVTAHLVGSIVLLSVVSGPPFALLAPFFAIFGWFFLVPEAIAVGIQWFAYRPDERKKKLLFLVASAVMAAPVVAMFGPKEKGSEVLWATGYAIAAAVAAICSGLVVQYSKNRK